ncbi:nitronate monooxygenase family protein [Brevundimonas sp. PAMC22021]|uniref:NAD(P)H-dependent flavin oxidoreductase n=1 Tax=Brevundimonas sp. PAMC22021 TaxID=2861285 RepID=UPI001C6315AB|nr:nitronate monooxygenase [Brevundimonas sp. PAMC22021]QYF87138.1 nitronate monooxygenase [Brevundimonas sp. PAMC22021]
MTLLDKLALRLPIVQAPMAGVSTPQLAAAVSNAGALGSIGVGATNASGAARMIDDVRRLTDAAFNVNVFVHSAPIRDAEREASWLSALEPVFREFGAQPPSSLATIYQSFADDDEMLRLLIKRAPPVISFHFGLPDQARVTALRQAGCVLIATATSLDEASAARRAGMDAVVAQGFEAGGHRGIFDPAGDDAQLGTVALTRLLVAQAGLPVVAAGGIMDGQGVSAVLTLGAVAAQLGTAFIACPESAADEAYRAALNSDAAFNTVMTDAISGRPARCLRNRFTTWAGRATRMPPDYPVAYDAGKAVNTAAKATGESGFGAQWAGQGAPLSRPMGAADLVRTLADELAA